MQEIFHSTETYVTIKATALNFNKKAHILL